MTWIQASITYEVEGDPDQITEVARDFLYVHRSYTPDDLVATVTDAGQGFEELMPLCPTALLAELKDIPADLLPPRLKSLQRLLRSVPIEMIRWDIEVTS